MAQSQIDPTLAPIVGGPDDGKVSTEDLRTQLATARDEITTKAELADDNTFTGDNTHTGDNDFPSSTKFKHTYADWVSENFNAAQIISNITPFAEITLTADMVLTSVSGGSNQAEVLMRSFKQDATGGRSVSFDTANFEIGAEGWPTVPTAPNSRSIFTLTRMPNNKWLVAVVALGVA